jgi:polyphosphate kinase
MSSESAAVSTFDDSLTEGSLFINRELSLLEFNRRVLAQAADPMVPLLERLRFLTIFSSNLDEFFEIRVAGLKQSVALDLGRTGPDGLSAQEVLSQISEVAKDMVERQYAMLNDELLPALARKDIFILKRSEWTDKQQAWIQSYFEEQVLPVLTPVALDPAHPFPNVQNKGLNLIVTLEGNDAFGRDSGIAIVQVPRCLPRLITLPAVISKSAASFVMIRSVIHAHIDKLFPGMAVTGCHQFRVTRNSDLWVDEEEVDDLLSALQGELPGRRYGQAVRLEVADNCSQKVAEFLLEEFGLTRDDLYQVNGPVNLHRVSAVLDLVDRPDLIYQPFIAGLPPRLASKSDHFAAIRSGDVLLHHPYQSFAPVVELIRQAATDPQVLAIKQTVYRTGADSPIVDALISAARSGKDVTAVVELRARFDEAANIRLATRLQQAGANVVYGVVGFKCHAKLLLIVRRESDRIRRYVHLGTGNYHTRTARVYTDFSYMTCREDIGFDVHQLFMQLTGLGAVLEMNKLLESPFTLHTSLIRMIEAEAEAARAGKPAHIRAKMNSLSEPEVIRALYRASQAGVQIDLIVRGVCRLRPGVPGVSDNIRVRSIVGRFLEHTRIYNFHAGGEELVFAASADWMTRNLVRRVEACFPIEEPSLKARAIKEALTTYLADNVLAWSLQSDGSYVRRAANGAYEVNAQATLLAEFSG